MSSGNRVVCAGLVLSACLFLLAAAMRLGLLPRRGHQAVMRAAQVASATPTVSTPQVVRRSTAPASRPAPAAPQELFVETAVWTVHLSLSPEQWEAMEPKQPERQPFGGGRWRGAETDYSQGAIAAPAFMRDGDADNDGRLSRAEMLALADRWFAKWDADRTGKLSPQRLRIGLTATLAATGAFPARASNLQGPEGKRNGLASAAGIDFEYVRADLEFEGLTLKDVGVRYKGNGTWMQSRGSMKRSLKIDTNRFVPGQRLAGITKLNLHNNVTDASWMNEVLSHRLFRDAGVPAPRTAYARVFLTVPGRYERQYLGLYSIVENIDSAFFRERLGTRGGAILKPVTQSLFADLGDDWSRYRQIYDPKTDLTDAQIRRIIEFCRLVTWAGDAEFAEKVGEYLDLEEFARFMAVTTWLSTLDSILSLGQNFYVYLHPRSNKFQFLPWDLDHSFGQFGMGASQSERENLSIMHPWRGENRFLERVFGVEAFRRLYVARMEEFSRTIFLPERFFRQVDEIASAIRGAVAEESEAKLARFERVVGGELPDAPRGEGGLWGGRGGRGFMAAKPIKGFVVPRAQSVLEQLAGRSEGMLLGGGGRGFFERLNPVSTLAGSLSAALDGDGDGEVGREEFVAGLGRLFDRWDGNADGMLEEKELREGLSALPRPTPGR